MAPANSQNPDDEGFEALLKPIQDVTRNWDVDLSLHLEEYLTHIRQICGDKLPDMNFAQAAVLVQNSANIYSKKVDYLFTTVMQLLDAISKKQNEARNRDKGDGVAEEGEGQPAAVRRRKPTFAFDSEEFNLLGDVYTERNITLDIEKEYKKNMSRKKPSIVLNPPSKAAVKSDDKLFCTVYDHAGKPLGKKDEFRLNWRISSDGILHEEFVVNKTSVQALEPIEITVLENGSAHDSHHDYEDLMTDMPEGDDDNPPLSTSLLAIAPNLPERESDVERARHGCQTTENVVEPLGNCTLSENASKSLLDPEKHKRGQLHEHIANSGKNDDWEPNDFNVNLEERPIKKRNVTKIPPKLAEGNENKRKHHPEDMKHIFTITDVLINPVKNGSVTFGKDEDFSFQAKTAMKHKKHLLQQHRLQYQVYLQNEAGKDNAEDFAGFHNDDESDDDFGFEGFENLPDDGFDADSDGNIINSQENPNWNEETSDKYTMEARRTLKEFNSRRDGTDFEASLHRRVAEWHQRIAPKLDAAEERSSFDIHVYGSKVLNQFKNQIGSTKLFAEIVAGQPAEEVSRYFLATLLLSNQYNLEISQTSLGELEKDCVNLKLLSTVRHHEELDDNIRITSEK